ncbi:disease resistance protein Roq1-like isoform X2 [Prosopis cineraria]|uniref:disease resistance protein Roq1-like isoform X2 n=1 Tax=Prosopis cineraria TaxID=364024 RepID=UPI00240FDE48|nr:disease resistance protein Roq1-like isoform X2 [Prosopis cineraria]
MTETPDFSGVPNLEHLNLGGCKSLVKVHPSLGELKRLVEIKLSGCINLEILPRKLETNSLKRLNLNGCKKVALLPKFGEGMNELSYLDVSFTDMTETPNFSGVPNLEHLNLEGCKSLVKVHPSLGELKRLVEIKLSGCINLEILPRKLETNSLKRLNLNGCKKVALLPKFGEGMNELSYLDVSFTDMTETPNFSGVPNLEHLNLEGCKSLVKVHPSLGELKRLVEIKLSGCINLEILPRKLETNSLKRLNLNGCKKVAVLPKFGEGMNKLLYIDVSFINMTRLPKSLDSLTVLEYSDFGGCKILHLDKLKTPIVRQISSFNVTSLTELYLDGCGLNDGSILDNFGNLSSLIALDLGENSFVNLPSGCFSGLSQLLYLFLDHCKRLKSLPWLPPRLIRLSAVGCDSMEALSDGELWNLVASRDHENRGRIEYANTNETLRHADDDDYCVATFMFEDVKSECLPQRDFIAIVPAGWEIPSWCTCTEYHILDEDGQECEIKVEIPQSFRASEWFGIVVCLQLGPSWGCDGMIWWSSRDAEGEDDYTYKKWAHAIPVSFSSTDYMCMMVLELNEKTCWQHLTPPNNSLHILLSTLDDPGLSEVEIMGCGWRLICKEDMKEWSRLNDLFTLPPTPHQVVLSHRILRQAADQTRFAGGQ